MNFMNLVVALCQHQDHFQFCSERMTHADNAYESATSEQLSREPHRAYCLYFLAWKRHTSKQSAITFLK